MADYSEKALPQQHVPSMAFTSFVFHNSMQDHSSYQSFLSSTQEASNP